MDQWGGSNFGAFGLAEIEITGPRDIAKLIKVSANSIDHLLKPIPTTLILSSTLIPGDAQQSRDPEHGDERDELPVALHRQHLLHQGSRTSGEGSPGWFLPITFQFFTVFFTDFFCRFYRSARSKQQICFRYVGALSCLPILPGLNGQTRQDWRRNRARQPLRACVPTGTSTCLAGPSTWWSRLPKRGRKLRGLH